MDRKLIDAYEAGGDKLRAVIAGLSPDDLHQLPAKDSGVGNWSIQQIIIHMMDSDLVWAARMKSIIAQEHPTIFGYDESKFADNLFYDKQDAQTALQIFDLNRRQFARVLRKLPDSAFSRTGQHNEIGAITLEKSLGMMVNHVDHHAKFIDLKRKTMGK